MATRNYSTTGSGPLPEGAAAPKMPAITLSMFNPLSDGMTKLVQKYLHCVYPASLVYWTILIYWRYWLRFDDCDY